MGRSRAKRREREREEWLRDMPSSVAMLRDELNQATQPRQNPDETMEDTMSLEDDGGVSLLPRDRGTNHQAAITEHMQQLYHQHPLTDTEAADGLWRLPVPPLYEDHMKPDGLNIKHVIAKTYHQCCRGIFTLWNCDPVPCIPDEFRAQTPYSMAMLCGLARLTTHTKSDLALAQTLMREEWHKRNYGLQPSPDHLRIIETKVKNCDGRFCERIIQENEFGLVLSDVRYAFDELVRRHYEETNDSNLKKSDRTPLFPSAKKSKKEKAKDKRKIEYDSAKQAHERAERRKQRNLRHAESSEGNDLTLETLPDQEMDIASTAPPNSPVLAGAAPRDLIKGMHANINGGAKQPGRMQALEEGYYKPTKKEIHNANHMSSWVDKMSMDSSKSLRKHQMKRMKEGGLSGRRGDRQTVRRLPSERSKFSSMAPLHKTESATGPTALDRLGQMRLSEDGSR